MQDIPRHFLWSGMDAVVGKSGSSNRKASRARAHIIAACVWNWEAGYSLQMSLSPHESTVSIIRGDGV